MSLVSLVYVSYSTNPMSEEDLLKILNFARENNQKENVTGMLLYRARYFIQVLEGEEENVDKIFASVAKDTRHGNLMLVQKSWIKERAFTEWSMGFKNLDKVDPANYPGFSAFLIEPLTDEYFTDDLNRAKQLLLAFKKETYF